MRLIALCGTAVMLYGLHLIWRPLAWIVGGCILRYACMQALKEDSAENARRKELPDPFAGVIKRMRSEGMDVTDLRSRPPN